MSEAKVCSIGPGGERVDIQTAEARMGLEPETQKNRTATPSASMSLPRPEKEYTGNLHHDFFRAIPFQRVKRLLEREKIDLSGRRVLVASCGRGIDVYYLRRYYNAEYHVSDICKDAVAAARGILQVPGFIEDNERLSLPDNAYDYVFIAASLHHLARPVAGLYELLRVAKYGLIVVEPNDSLLTRMATRLGLANETEESGNYVYRMSRHDVARIAKALTMPFRVDRFFAIHRVAKSRIEFRALQVVNSAANIVWPSQGNYIVFLLRKASEGMDCR